ncbi:Os07g0552232 [Oryza sativa Japonica Group]|uniref:Os07g0552232 protein n=1 Tax=Oryza sativa subsp. japonica TaxID=39947 RepID=A0A0P0X7J3_ORYSJ|nr:Os07g0552232 [Oryza sativa Japonica Group]
MRGAGCQALPGTPLGLDLAHCRATRRRLFRVGLSPDHFITSPADRDQSNGKEAGYDSTQGLILPTVEPAISC